MKKITSTGYYSWKIGSLCKGCRQCIKGQKLVLYITGLCPRKCFYCPLSETRANKDLMWANEHPITTTKEAIEEAKLCDAKGAGITGGDPLLKMDRTVKFIKALKRSFGKSFHIHLYTSLILVDEKRLKRLYESGLDEIRFHPDFNKEKEWEKIFLAKRHPWKVGVEIPVIPQFEEQTKKLLAFLSGRIDFLNLNELEISDTNANKLVNRGYKPKDRISYGVKGSETMALKLLKLCEKNNLKFDVHYCSTRLKDKVQLGERLKRRAKNVKKTFDVVDGEGMLVRGCIYLKGLEPGFDYERRVKAGKKKIPELKKARKEIMKDLDVPASLIEVDEKKLRILIAPWILEKISIEIKHKCAIVKEYPTYDNLIVDLEYLGI